MYLDDFQIDIKENLCDVEDPEKMTEETAPTQIEIQQQDKTGERTVNEKMEKKTKSEESFVKIREENVKLPSGITLKRVESKENQQKAKSSEVPKVDKLANKNAAEIVGKFKTVNSGLKISFCTVK